MMWNLAENIGGFYVWMVSSENVYINERPKDFYQENWLKFGCQIGHPEKLNKIQRELSQYSDRLELTNSALDNMEVNPIGVHKASALEKVCKKLGITMDQVLAAGDSLNDQKMLEAAGIGVAMGKDRKSTRLNSSHVAISYAVFCLKKKRRMVTIDG